MTGKKILILYLLYIIFSAFLLFSPSKSIAAMFDPSFRFSTIETDNFIIHSHQGLEGIADKAASIAENVHKKLSVNFQWTPTEKTHIVMIDNTDFANGLTTVLPYNMIYIFTVPPMPDMPISEYYDWLEMIIIHEYAHILTMDPVRGYSSVMRYIFGKTLPGYDPLSSFLFLFTAPPNIFMPDWWHEGMSTWAETEFTKGGRGKSTYYEMIFRMAVHENSLPRIDHINGDVPYWPGGHMPYIYGLLLEKYIAQKYGKDIPGKINITQAGRLPYFIGAPAILYTAKHYVHLHRDALRSLEEEQLQKIEHLRLFPLTEYKVLPLQGELLTNPSYSPDGRYIAINRRDPHKHEDIIIVESISFKEITSVRRLYSDHGISWSPDSKMIYFTQADLRGGFNLYQDVYSFEIEKESVKRITTNLRAKDIDISPDGNYFIFVKAETARQHLALLSNRNSEDVKILASFKDCSISGPRWSPDGKFIVFSKRGNTGETYIELFNIETLSTKTLIQDGNNNIYPEWTPDGRFIIFTSDRTGVYNLFAYSLNNGEILQITHVLGGAFQADILADYKSLIFSGYHSKGFYIAEMPYDPSKWSKVYSPVVQPTWKESKENEDQKSIDIAEKEEQTPVAVHKKKRYSPFKTLNPRFWLPTLSSDDEGAVLGAFTAGQDVLGYHTYLLRAEYGISRQFYFDTYYIYDRWYPTFFIRGYSQPYLYSDLFDIEFDDSDDYYERRSGLIAGIRIPIDSLESRYSFIAGYHIEKLEEITSIHGRTVDGLEVYEGRRDNIFIGFEYIGALKYPYSISREEGRNISLLYKYYSEKLGGGINQHEYSAGYEEFIGLGKHHVLYLNLKGATSDGDLIAQQAFQMGGIPGSLSQYPLRGYSEGFETGRSILTCTLEHRFPIRYILRGIRTKPFFFDRLHIAAFVDAGNVWGYNKDFHWDDVSVGIGFETRFDMVLGYHLKITPALGIAHGLNNDGETQVYLTIYTTL